MSLDRYREKRDFKATPEPRGRVAKASVKDRVFVIQKHAASHLHYDFRLELDGVLLSWAVPKGPSMDPADKRLAMHVEDHPLEYGSFEGTIPAKQYGGGTVLLWDRGAWTPKGDARQGYAKGHLKFELSGEKLRGGWDLVRTAGNKFGNGAGKEAWLLIKENDAFARHGTAIVDEQPDSVATGRSLDDIAGDQNRVWHSNRSVEANVKSGALKRVGRARVAKLALRQAAAADVAPAALSNATKATLPASLAPQLATLVAEVPRGDDWLHEVKYDGYRMLCRIDGSNVRIYSRNGKEWTAALGQIVAAAKRLKLRSAWLDGELTVLTPEGHTSFQLLQNALADPAKAAFVYFAFDIAFCNGYDLTAAPLLERKKLLRRIVPDHDAAMRYGVEIQGAGDEFLKQACKLGLEGVVSKRTDSAYHAGLRNKDWVKVKCGKRQEMVIGGFTDPQGSRSGIGALLLGVYDGDNGLRYSGRVGTGFDDRTLKTLRQQLDKLTQDDPPFFNPPRGAQARGVHWVRPTLVAEVAFTEWTSDGTLRHPSFQGLREDQPAIDVVRESVANDSARTPTTTSARPSARRPMRTAASRSDKSSTVIAGVRVSHPEKLYFPEAKLTKADIAAYYAKVSAWMLPHLRDRPLSLVRCPDGWQGQCFYQKHADKSVDPAVDRMVVPEGGGKATYLSANSATAIVALLQWGVIEFHPWGSRKRNLDRPDQLIFDLDPDEGIAWKEVAAAATLTRTLLTEIGVSAFLKTTGGKGLHVVVPIQPTLSWDDAKRFTKAVADLMVSTFPDRFIATMSKSQRKGKIFVDYLRNAEGATAIAPYSVRARAGAPVSTPIAWEELKKDVRSAHFNVSNVPARLARLKRGPWDEFFTLRQTITKAMMKRLGASAA